ncbi:MAG: DUF4160 domain-containing protein [Erysipelotrichales bacterium]|nr:DUF4160 domain-containing protein [Erysipelotrichales bacterium]
MAKENMKIEFEVISYNLLANNDLIPTEVRVVYESNIDSSLNFLSVVNNIVESFKIKENLEQESNFYLDNIYEELWSEYFHKELLDELLKSVDKHNYSRFNVSVKELNDQFNLTNKRIKIVIPCNGGNGDLCFFFHIDPKNTKPRPHIHCKYCGLESMIDLRRLEFIKDNFHSMRISEIALDTVRRHQDELINYWDKIRLEGEKVKFTMIV